MLRTKPYAEWRPPSDIPMEAPPAEIPQDPPEQEPTVPEEKPPPPEVEEEAGASHTVRGSCDVCEIQTFNHVNHYLQ